MKATARLLAAFLLLMPACSSKKIAETPAESSSPQEDSMTTNTATNGSQKAYEFRKLANGMEVYLVKKTEVPIITILVASKNGAYTESPEYNGLSHLYEHMFFKANQKIPSQSAFMAALDDIGAEIGQNMNAYTSTESVRYFFTIQTQVAERGVEFIADALKSPAFLQDELEKERQVVLDEFNRFEASPQQVFYQMEVMKRLFPTHFSRKNTIGMRNVIENASQEQMREIQKRYYIPNNTALFLVGYFDESKLWPAVEKAFGDWQPGPDPFTSYPIPEHPALTASESFNHEADVQTVSLVKSFHGPSLVRDNSGIIAFDLMSQMLSYESSPFQKELVDTGLAASASFHSWSQRYTSPLFFEIETSPDKAQKAADKFTEIIRRIAKGGFFTERDLETAKISTEVRSAFDHEVGQRYALGLASIWTSTGSLDFYTNYVNEMKKISLQDIEREAREYLLDKPFVAGALIPKGSTPIKFN